jgi:hypothetical protein
MEEKRKKYEFLFTILVFSWLFLALFLLETNFYGNFGINVIIVIILFIGLLLLAKTIHNHVSDFPWLSRTPEEGDEPAILDCELVLPYHETFDRCIQSVRMFRDLKIELSDKHNGIINAIVPDRPFYNPEMDLRQSVITVTIHQKTKTETHVTIFCKRAPHSPASYGMNKAIVEKICTFLQDPSAMINAEKENVSSY